jgi:signal transduction histidine kinase
MTLQGGLRLATDPQLEARLQQVVNEIDETIRDIRSTIFGLRAQVDEGPGVRGRVLDVASRHAAALGFDPVVHFDGPIDSLTDAATGDHMLAAFNEVLSNAARHAGASQVDVYLSAGHDLWLRVVDDGRGFAATTERRSGLANLARRAEQLGGSLLVDSRPGEGTTVEWRVPFGDG